jgi:preprotein translocase SecF subunit
MMNLIPTQKFNFLRHAKVAVFASLALLLAGAAAFIMRGERNYGVDFRGGDLLTMSSAGPVEVSQVREALKPLRIDDDSSIQQSQQVDRHYLMIRSPMGTSDAIQNQIMTAMPNAGLRWKAPSASERSSAASWRRSRSGRSASVSLGILIYVTFRFELSFAVGAIVAVLHDVLITVGIFSLMGRELTLTMVGAVLTIAGYSINDTIVVFDRIREGLARGQRGSIEQIMNTASTKRWAARSSPVVRL